MTVPVDTAGDVPAIVCAQRGTVPSDRRLVRVELVEVRLGNMNGSEAGKSPLLAVRGEQAGLAGARVRELARRVIPPQPTPLRRPAAVVCSRSA